MSGIAAAIGGSAVLGLGGSILSSNAAKNAANTQAGAAMYAADLQNNQFQQQQANQAPFRSAGYAALNQMQDPFFINHDFSMQDFQADPGYAFRLQQGQQALERSAAAQGGLQTGGTLKSLTDYAQGSASQEYENAYNRFTNNQSNRFNRLASLAGIGQTATNQVGQAGENMATNVGQDMMGAANARGAAGIASANAYGSALNGMGNNLMTMGMLNKFAPQKPQPVTQQPPEMEMGGPGYSINGVPAANMPGGSGFVGPLNDAG